MFLILSQLSHIAYLVYMFTVIQVLCISYMYTIEHSDLHDCKTALSDSLIKPHCLAMNITQILPPIHDPPPGLVKLGVSFQHSVNNTIFTCNSRCFGK